MVIMTATHFWLRRAVSCASYMCACCVHHAGFLIHASVMVSSQIIRRICTHGTSRHGTGHDGISLSEGTRRSMSCGDCHILPRLFIELSSLF